MRRVSIFGVTPGMRLAKGIRGSKDELLLAGGVTLQPSHLKLLRERGCYLIDVEDGMTDDIVIDEVVSREVRRESARAVQHIYKMLGSATTTLDLTSEEQARRGLQTKEFANATRDEQPIKALMAAAMSIVDDVLNSESALGLNSIRLYDEYTFQHSVSTAIAGVMIARDMSWQRSDLCDLAMGCLMHDIGKVLIDREVLNKPGRLTPDETQIIQQHAQLGYDIVLQIFGPGILSNHVPYQHHERQNGTGYPRGLKGNNTLPNPRARVAPGYILPIAELAAVADVYDALGSDRPYRPALPPDQLSILMASMSGTSLNAAVLERFLAILSPFPVGAEVMLHGDPALEACKGVVVKVHRGAQTRPLVRILYDPHGAQVQPFEVDLREHQELTLESTLIFAVGAMNPLTAEQSDRLMEGAKETAQFELTKPSIC